MNGYVRLDDNARDTIERMTHEVGLAMVAEHTGLSSRVIARAVDPTSRGISEEERAAIVAYLKGRV